MSKISEHIQKASLGAEVELYQLDLSLFNEGTLYWVAGDEGALTQSVSFDGQEYTPFPITAEGFEQQLKGPLARPTVTVANASGILTPFVVAHGYLVGATFRRIRTFAKFLDDGADPDGDAILRQDEYTLRRLLKHRSRQFLKWELAASIDATNAVLPARQIVRDFCDHSYRYWDATAGAFNYDTATCPFAEAAIAFDATDTATSPQNDVCGKRLGSCKLRFGANAELPFRGFPGVARIRVR
jgi:lambda family phage minor tail protein L